MSKKKSNKSFLDIIQEQRVESKKRTKFRGTFLEYLELIKKNKMIYDCFSYWDEDLLLDLRLNILNKFVDYFVIVEGNKTWQNNPKKLRFKIDKFQKFKDKIIYVPVEDMPDGDDPYKRENFQRNCILRGIKNSKGDDIIMISDLDEIPNPNLIKNFKLSARYAVFKQKHFYYKINLMSNNNPYWYGTRICVKKYLKSPQWLRDLKFKKRPFWRIDKLRLNNIINRIYTTCFKKRSQSQNYTCWIATWVCNEPCCLNCLAI